MTRERYLGISLVAALALAGAVIVVAGYYDSLMLLVAQIAMIAGPSFGPFFVLSALPDRRFVLSLLCAAVVAVGWGFVAYVDAQPYIGGGASLAPIFGWFACGGASMLAAAAVFWRGGRSGLE